MTQITDIEKYKIISRKDLNFAGLFFVGVTSTGVFCRPGCPARTPKFENCMFFDTAQTALIAGFRACKRCHPMRLPGEESPLIKHLITAIEKNPEKKWSEIDLRAIDIDPSTARRQFKSRFGQTFAQYARARRLALAVKTLDAGDRVIDAQIDAGYSSASGFRTAYMQKFGTAPAQSTGTPLLIDWLDTKLGPMIAIADETHLYLIEFTIRKNLNRQVQRLAKHYKRPIIPGHNKLHDQIHNEITHYFEGKLQDFTIPIRMTGTDFQKTVWHALQTIPYGDTWSYVRLAQTIGNPKGVRAVASSNASNGLAIVIPCHRVIAKDGGLGGYAGGLAHKRWLLDMEVKAAYNTPK